MHRTILVPYDSGYRGLRMGAGPLRLAELLGDPVEIIETGLPFPTEIATAFDLYRRVAETVHETVAAGGAYASGDKIDGGREIIAA